MDPSKAPSTPSINGVMTVLGPRHSIAIYERNREHYVAEFHGGCGELTHASSWFRLNAAALRYRKGPLTEPLDAQTLRKIERLHAENDARQERMLALPRKLAAAARNYLASALSRLQGRASAQKVRVPTR